MAEGYVYDQEAEGYVYDQEKSRLFTDEAQKVFIKVRDNALRFLEKTGAFMAYKPFSGMSGPGDTFLMLAMLDRMVELGDIVEITGPSVCGQNRVFISSAIRR